MTCKHTEFSAMVGVHRLTKGEEADSPVRAYVAKITVKCAECGEPFQFLGLPGGYSMDGATVSVDCLIANLAIAPNNETVSHLGRIAMYFPAKGNA